MTRKKQEIKDSSQDEPERLDRYLTPKERRRGEERRGRRGDLDREVQRFLKSPVSTEEDRQRVMDVFERHRETQTDGLEDAASLVRSILRKKDDPVRASERHYDQDDIDRFRGGPFWRDYEGERDIRGRPINLEEELRKKEEKWHRRQGQTPPPTPTVSGTREPASRTYRKGGVVKRKPREFAKGGAYRGKPHAYAAGGRVTDASASRRRSQRNK